MDSRIKFLEHELAEQEREMTQKQTSAETLSDSRNADALEQKVRELEAIVKGLTGEVLDLKSVTRRLSQQLEGGRVQAELQTEKPSVPERRGMVLAGKRPIAEPAPRVAPTGGSAPRAAPRHVISSPGPEPVPAPEVPVEELKLGEFEYVMQPDGSILKRRKTADKNVIVAGTGFSPGHISRSNAIRADSDAVIEAVEDDTVMDDAKKRS
jgi:hypothetical protein